MDFLERMKKTMTQGFETTKKGLEQAADKAREVGEKGVLKYEISRLEKDVERNFALIGSQVYDVLVKKGQNTVSKSTAEVKELLATVEGLEKRIAEKEKALEKVGS
jgi:uncharacterized protein YceH (UPF0502 family)